MDEELKEALELIYLLVDESDCRLDHHGYCQEHSHFHQSECTHAKAKKFLKRFKLDV